MSTRRGPDMSSQEQSSALRAPTPEVLTEFILSLVQAFLRTGYYLPEHPESKKARVGLYNRFKGLFTGRHELTFMLKEMGEVQNILVDGPLPETQQLRSLMTKGMAEVYVPRLSKFLERKDLVSLTLKEDMGELEFSHFVDVMSEPSFQTLDAEGKNVFVEKLREQEITHISFVFNEDIVTVERKLPWRAQLSISRLKKDLKCIPLFQSLDEEGFHSLRKQVMRDVLRPINKPDLMSAILLNSDLACTGEVSEDEIEDEVVAYISEDKLAATGREALRIHKETETGREPEGRKRALAKFYRRLHRSEEEGVEEVVREFFAQDLVNFQALPEDLQLQITIEKEADRFLDERTKMMVLYENTQSAAEHQQQGEFLLSLIPELARRDRLDEVLFLTTTFRGHASLGGFRAPNATAILQKIITGPIGVLLKDRFLKGKKEDRISLGPIFQSLGDPWIPHVVEIVETTEDPWVRKNAFETLIKMGSEAETSLLKAVVTGQFPTKIVAQLLMVYGELEDTSAQALHVLKQHIRHKEPKLREEAAWALCRIQGREDEELFLHLLDDTDMGVKKRAIRCLRTLRSEKGLARFTDILHNLEQKPELKALEVSIYQAFSEFPEAMISEGVKTEQYLLNLLQACFPSGLKGMLHRGKNQPQLSQGALYAVCETLGTIGTEDSLAFLKGLSKRFGEPSRTKIKRAIEHIESRLVPDEKAARETTAV
jgi:hypothetical protein